ncbi:hypothetical protein HPB51_004295 [Rhipicephalus microplus]|uniref:Uncharacterized protein n=1 Tax=Rhipicephalus microplus TaxID=6941 RepID=A0A9J6EL35_RHIMP|nr:hypothetical protein HPB51_004295 [Rhipicephalus microplus]
MRTRVRCYDSHRRRHCWVVRRGHGPPRLFRGVFLSSRLLLRRADRRVDKTTGVTGIREQLAGEILCVDRDTVLNRVLRCSYAKRSKAQEEAVVTAPGLARSHEELVSPSCDLASPSDGSKAGTGRPPVRDDQGLRMCARKRIA